MSYLFILFIVVMLCGCTKGEEKDQQPDVVDYATGAEQLKSYKKARSTIDNIAKSREENDFWNK